MNRDTISNALKSKGLFTFRFSWGDAGPLVSIPFTKREGCLNGLLPIGDEDDIAFSEHMADEYQKQNTNGHNRAG